MPATKIRVPKYRKHAASGQARVTLGGHTHYLGLFNSPESLEKYDRLVAEWLAGRRQGPRREDDGPAVVEVVLAYDRHAEEYYANSPKERDKVRLALRPLRELYGRSPVRAFDSVALEAVRERMVDAGLARTTVNERVAVLRRFFRWAVRRKMAPAAVYGEVCAVPPLKAGRTRARETPAVGPVPREHVDAVLPHVGRHVAGLVRLQWLTGARSGELVILRPCDIDASAGDVWVYRPSRHKNTHRGMDRRIYFGPQAQDLLRPFLAETDPAGFVFSPARARAERYRALRAARKSKVPPSQRDRRKAAPKRTPGPRYTTHSYRKAVVTACRKAGVPRWFPHQLRHAAATRLKKEYGVESARLVLGHASVATTERYAARDFEQAARVMTQVG